MAIRKPEDVFINCLAQNLLLRAQKILQCNPEVDHHSHKDYAFISACNRGYIDTAMWLYSLGGYNEDTLNNAFICSCKRGFLEVSKWLFSTGKINIHFKKDSAFINTCHHGFKETAEWLRELSDQYSIKYKIPTNIITAIITK